MPVVHVKAEHWRNISSRFFFNLIYFSKLCEMHFMVLCSCSMLSKFYVRPVQSIPLSFGRSLQWNLANHKSKYVFFMSIWDFFFQPSEGKYSALICSEGKHMSIRDFSNVSFRNFSFNTCLINCNWKTQTLYLGLILLPKQCEKNLTS